MHTLHKFDDEENHRYLKINKSMLSAANYSCFWTHSFCTRTWNMTREYKYKCDFYYYSDYSEQWQPLTLKWEEGIKNLDNEI
jgi:hypothetical protein